MMPPTKRQACLEGISMASTTGTGVSTRQRLSDLETTPELAAAVDEACRAFGTMGRRDRQRIEEDLKLLYYFRGTDVAVLVTDRD
jgi:hypothetical protein